MSKKFNKSEISEIFLKKIKDFEKFQTSRQKRPRKVQIPSQKVYTNTSTTNQTPT